HGNDTTHCTNAETLLRVACQLLRSVKGYTLLHVQRWYQTLLDHPNVVISSTSIEFEPFELLIPDGIYRIHSSDDYWIYKCTISFVLAGSLIGQDQSYKHTIESSCCVQMLFHHSYTAQSS